MIFSIILASPNNFLSMFEIELRQRLELQIVSRSSPLFNKADLNRLPKQFLSRWNPNPFLLTPFVKLPPQEISLLRSLNLPIHFVLVFLSRF